jgi:hypothetical protein
MRNAHNVFNGKYEGKRPLGRFRRKWDGIKVDVKIMIYEDLDWIHLAQDWGQ